MYVLFLESKAAQQIRDYCANHPDHEHTVEETLQRGYKNSEQYRTSEDWVKKCLNNDSHKEIDVDRAFTWSDSPEGHEYWASINEAINDGDDIW